MTVFDDPAVVQLSDEEGLSLLASHPSLIEHAGDRPIFLATAALNAREAEVLGAVMVATRHHIRDLGVSAREILQVLLPPERLRTSPGVLRQIERNAQAQKDLESEFGLLSSKQVAGVTGSTAKNVAAAAHRFRKDGRIFSVDVGGEQLFPGFEFGADGKPRAVIGDVVSALADKLTGWELALWFTGDNAWLGGIRPVDAISATDSDRAAVVDAASRLSDELGETGSTTAAAR